MQKDRTIRAMTNDGAFRVITVRAVDLAREAIEAQAVSGDAAERFAELLVSAIMVRETMAPTLRVQTVLTVSDRASVVADSHPGGLTRGLVSQPEDESQAIELGSGTALQIVRALPNGELHRGIVSTDGEKGLSGALVRYMTQSEQVESMIGVAAKVTAERVEACGGYIIQRLPEAEEEAVETMRARMAAAVSVGDILAETDSDPAAVVSAILGDYEWTLLDESDLNFGCLCSEVRVLSAVSLMEHDEIQALVDEGEVLSIDCDYCGTVYEVGTEKLKSLLDES